ncbi:ImmA/IrrE family metallo-endopeptidase [Enterococcus durans]|uniref:ImmA/IrrE family metallo-endopeptidase n=1 Tax=Enterococcus durans TaxID=53345 RepID=UPI003BE950E6
MDNIKELLKENGIELVVTDLDIRGFYIPKHNAIFVNQNLSDKEQKQVILHELSHALNDSDFSILYKNSAFHSKMECAADKFMINYLIEENGGYYDYSGVLERFNLGLGWEINLK